MARNDTTTTINAPTVAGGDRMDESIVTQSDGTTQAKRPRVVVGDDLGRLAELIIFADGRAVFPVYDQLARGDRDRTNQLLEDIKMLLIQLLGK